MLSHPHFRELTSRTRLSVISERYSAALELGMDRLDNQLKLPVTGHAKDLTSGLEVSMWHFCRETVFTASVESMYGPSLLRDHPETFKVRSNTDGGDSLTDGTGVQ
jgi:hypothetical protein